MANYQKHSQAKEVFAGLRVLKPSGESVLLSDAWKERPVVLKVLARLGCAACQYEAQAMSALHPLLEEQGVGLVAVTFEDVDLELFLKCGYWKWDILIDPKRQVYQAAGLMKTGTNKSIKTLFSRRPSQCLELLEEKGFFYNSRRDICQLGGTFVIDTNGTFIYEFRPSEMAMLPSLREIISVVGGDPEDIEDDSLKAFTCPGNKDPFKKKSKFRLSFKFL
ncbi:hypothetical protein DSO57_1002924 [Entomophthora muscae]|uniref:Uncharacterized protein n=2 Tax=Entomophthora muscae TaxID=34485 RepID=A0ACC2T548_9FUNG|nr:hypothetical protein DSO57_1015955 [Entomophthora muscae]KAJ9070864.1 hypothetical protein DSO57_1002924 [Entomophthora muscae]